MVNRVGQQLGNYTIVRKLGEGGFAEVYLGEHIHLGTYAAIKILHTQLLGGDTDTFRREARTVAHLIHPHIVRVLDFGIEGSTPFLVMDYAPHGTLRQRHPRGTRLPLPTVVEYVGQIASGLQYAHDKKLIHRDVKPENMLIGQNNALLLSDFGIALVTQSSRYQGTLEMAGTMAYMSPEQIQGKPRPASDQYALGIVVYEWLTGDRPFHGSLTEIVAQHLAMTPPPLREKLPAIPQSVEEVVMTALAKDPHARHDSIRTFAEELKRASQQQSSSTHVVLSQTPPFLSQPFPTNAPTTPKTVTSLSPTMPISSHVSVNRESRILPTMPHVNILPSMSPPTSVPLPRKRRSTRKLILATLALLVLLLGGLGIYYPISIHNAALVQQASTTAVALATRDAPITATARVQATETAIIAPYNTAVAANGIMFGFDAQHTHYNPYERILSPANVSGLVQDWTAAIGYQNFSSPVVVNGVVYIGSYDHKLYAFDAKSGATLWTASTGNIIQSSPAFADGIIYVGSWDGKFYAFDAKSGATLWTASTGGLIQTSPVVANGVVYVGSYYGKLYAFNAKSGATLWTTGIGGSISSSAAVADGIVYVGSNDYKLYAVDAKSGAILCNCSYRWFRSLLSSCCQWSCLCRLL